MTKAIFLFLRFFVLILLFISGNWNIVFAQPLGERIKLTEPKIEEREYFILYISTNTSVNAIASGTIQSYENIRKLSDSVPVYFVFNNHGVSDITAYAKQNFFADTAVDKYLHFIENENLNQLIHIKGGLTQVYFIKDNELIYVNDAKYNFVGKQGLPIHTTWDKQKFPVLKFKPDRYYLPKEIISVREFEGIKHLSTTPLSGTFQFSRLDYIYPVNDKEMVILMDAPNECILFDMTTGKEVRIFPKADSPISIFKQWHPDLTETEIQAGIKFENEFLKKVNRKSHYLWNFSNQKDDQRHVVSSGLQIGFPFRKEYTIKNGLGKNKDYIIKQGDIFGLGLNYLEIADKDWKQVKRYRRSDAFLDLSNMATPDSAVLVPDTEYGMYWVDDSVFYATHSYCYDESMPDTFKNFIGRYQLNEYNLSVTLLDFMPPQMNKQLKKKYVEEGVDFSYFFKMNEQVYCVLNLDNAIFQIDQKEPVSFLGNKKLGNHRKNENKGLNYEIMSVDYYDGLLYAVYNFKGKKCFLEIKNSLLETIKIMDISTLQGVAENKVNDYYGIKVFNGKLYAKYLKNKQVYLSSYSLMGL